MDDRVVIIEQLSREDGSHSMMSVMTFHQEVSVIKLNFIRASGTVVSCL